MIEDEKRERTPADLRLDNSFRRGALLCINQALDLADQAKRRLLSVTTKPYSLGESYVDEATARLRRSRAEVEKEIEACKEKLSELEKSSD